MSAHRILTVVLLVAAVLLWGAPAPAAEDPADRAQALIDAGRTADAVSLLETAVAADPENPRLHFLLGVAYHRAGRVPEAAERFEAALALDPDDARTHYNLGAAYFAQGRWDDAARAFLAVPERAPDMAAAGWLNAGLARAKQGRVAEARALLEKSLAADPEGGTADTARRVLAVLDQMEAAADVAAEASTEERPPSAPSPLWRTFGARLEVGKEYDSNVFSLPDDATTTDLSDWRTTVRVRLDQAVSLAGGRYRVTPRYDFYGRWYNAESAYDYRRHRLLLRLDLRGNDLEPRLEYAYSYSELGADAYLNTHRIGGRVALRRAPGRRLWAAAHVELSEAPGQQYEYLSGTEWEGSLAAYTPVPGEGKLYAELAGRYADRGTQVLSTASVVYSYAALEPFVYVAYPVGWKMELTGTLRYEFRRYADPDRWTSPATGAKRRQDHRFDAGLALSRPLLDHLEVEVGWQGQARRSNIGDAPGDYRDRDYNRQVYGVFLKGDL